jgi:prolyl-tRNA synthetase
MRMSSLVGRRDKDTPKEAQIVSHQLLLRGGYIRQVGAGLYTLLPLAVRVIKKIESIIRNEMNSLEGQEVLFPVVLPKELWNETGRYDAVGDELLRFKDRSGAGFVLGMTHEEASVHLARSDIFSYKQLPFTIYQIQTKFRDEPRSRGGLIRVREFTMKDAYSFHEDEACLSNTYDAIFSGYENIFKKVGLKNFISVESDTGMMGGGVSHEFMSILDIGEDSLLLCSHCDYQANRDIAKTNYPQIEDEDASLTEVATPDKKSIEEVSEFLKVDPKSTAKCVFYKDEKGELVTMLIRGDLEVNEVKVKGLLQTGELIMADDDLITQSGMVPGFASPMVEGGLDKPVLIDHSLKNRKNLVAGANKLDTHYTGFSIERDLKDAKIEWVDVASVVAGDACPKCGKELDMKRGVEIGNIFKLGDKYTKSMKMTYLDRNGKAQTPIMGCYGIGVGRLMACIVEEHHDKFGPIWPSEIAPFTVQINILDLKKEDGLVKAEKVYKELQDKGIEVVIDDRGEKAGFQFSDADLLGIPHRLIFSPKNLKEGKVEYRTRASRDSVLFDLESVVEEVLKKIG